MASTLRTTEINPLLLKKIDGGVGVRTKPQSRLFRCSSLPLSSTHQRNSARDSAEMSVKSFLEAEVEALPAFEGSIEKEKVLPLPVPPRNRADLSSLHNPLKRFERMGCGWFAVVLEWDGVIVEDDASLEQKAWTALAEEEGKPRPLAFVLKKTQGMKNEQAISEVLCWTRDPLKLRDLSRRKEEIYETMQGGVYRVRPGAREFIEVLKKYKIPIALASTRPKFHTDRAIEAVGMEGFFDVVITAEDVYRGKPDPEMFQVSLLLKMVWILFKEQHLSRSNTFQYACERLGFIPERCIIVGNSNKTIEAAHDALMKVGIKMYLHSFINLLTKLSCKYFQVVAVVGMHPAYELGAADLIVSRLDGLSMVDLKNLADVDSPEFLAPELELETVQEEEKEEPRTLLADSFPW